MTWMGIDGCPGGWVYISKNKEWEAGIIRSLTDIHHQMARSSLVLIDMPIGFPDSKNPIRACDSIARKILGKKGSSVFPVPARETLEAESYQEGQKINKEILGRGLSRQSWGLVPRLKELDIYLQGKGRGVNIREAHPEVLFWYLNKKKAIKNEKKTFKGFIDRFNVVSRYYPKAINILDFLMENFLRKELKRDDITDALVLVTSAFLGKVGLQSLPPEGDKDQKGLRREIVLPTYPGGLIE